MRIEVRNLVQGYGKHNVLDGISFEAETGEITAVLGPNGSGKSTLIRTICDLMPPVSGNVMLDGTDVHDIDVTDFAKLVSYVPQSSDAGVYTTVLETVLLGRKPYVTWNYRDKDIQYALDAMRLMNVSRYASRNVTDLSGGQRQRVFIARSLAQCPSVYIFDEPTSALDLKHQMNTMIRMREVIRTNGSGMIVALHDMNLALNYTDRVIMLKNGRIHAHGPPEETITEENIREVYGVESRIVETEVGRYILPISPLNMEDDDP